MNATKEHMIDMMNHVSDLSIDVTASTEEMASAVVEQAASTEEFVNYTKKLNEQSANLQNLIDQFKL